MIFKNSLKMAVLAALLAATSGCEIFATEEEVVDPVTGAITVVPVTPREPYSGGRGGGGSGGWGG